MGIFDWYKRKKYYYSLSKEERERYKKERECNGHLFSEVKDGGKGGKPFSDEIYLKCSKCGFGYYKSTLTKEEKERMRKHRPIKNWNEPIKNEIPTFQLTKEPEEKTSSETKKYEEKKFSFGKQYHDLEEILLSKNSSYNEEYGFIKLLREKLKSGDVYLEEISSYIKDYYKKYDGDEIMTKTELYNQLEHIFTVYLEDWEKKKETTFVGFEDVEQYHSLSQKIVVELGDLLKEKIMELGK